MPRAPESAASPAPLPVVVARGATARSTCRARRGASSPHAQPFLKWAGGKRQLLPELRRFYPADFGAYHEPFFGSGAVFFDLLRLGRLDGHRAVLSDTNPDVVGCCRALRDGTDAVITQLRRLARAHDARGAEHYYTVRDQRFNPARRRLLAGHEAPERPAYTPALAAMLIYLNHTGFNGLFRINSRGEFNVPVGRYANPAVCDEGNLRLVAAAFARPAIELAVASFEAVLDRARRGDFVYLDPPYAPLTRTARFTSYTADGFSEAQHVLLQRTVVELATRGCAVVLSNSVAPLVRDLYDLDAAARASGLRAHLVPARRAINCLASRRRGVFEYVITNVLPATPARPS